MLAAPACLCHIIIFISAASLFTIRLLLAELWTRIFNVVEKGELEIELANGMRNPSEFIKISFAIGLCGAADGFALASNSKQPKLRLSASRHHAGHPRRKWDFIRPVRLQDAFSGNYDKWCRMFLRIFFSLRCSPLIQLINVLLVVFPTSFFIFFFDAIRQQPPLICKWRLYGV